MKLIFFGHGGVATPSLHRLQQLSWCTIVQTMTVADFVHLKSADVGVVINFGHIIPQSVIDHFPFGIVNLHPSLLPRWRGPSPIKSALLYDDSVTGVSLILIDTGLDTGPILAQQAVAIIDGETNIELEARLAEIGAELLIQILPQYVAGRVQSVPQPITGITLSKLIRRQDGELTTQLSQRDMWNRYRAFQPWPGVFFEYKGRRYKITRAHWQAEKFMCDEIQPDGKRPMSLADFKRGYAQVSFADII